MFKNTIALVGIALTLVTLAGCEDNPVDPPDPLTEAEALTLFKALAEGTGFAPDDDMGAATVDTTVACPLGGEAKVVGQGRAQPVGDTLRTALEAVITPAGCKVPGDGATFTVDGNPSFSIEVITDIIGFEKLVMGGGVEGPIKWQLEDRSGECTIDLLLNATSDLSDPAGPELTGGYAGKMCGHDIEIDVSLIFSG